MKILFSLRNWMNTIAPSFYFYLSILYYITLFGIIILFIFCHDETFLIDIMGIESFCSTFLRGKQNIVLMFCHTSKGILYATNIIWLPPLSMKRQKYINALLDYINMNDIFYYQVTRVMFFDELYKIKMNK